MGDADTRNGIAEFIHALKSSRRLGGVVVHHETIPAHPSQFESLDVPLPDAISEMLGARGIASLYAHQVRAIEPIRDGGAVVVATPTASGKSLIYLLPILESILDSPDTRALYISPLKALAQDQFQNFNRLVAALPDPAPTAAIYDGDTTAWHRRKIRDAPPHLLLTNPEMLHLALLPYHDRWNDFFRNLRFVVIDEVHTYRGIMGSHMAMVFRRLLRVCRHYGSHPTLVCSSATVLNPKTLAETLTGIAPVTEIVDSGAPRGERHVVMIDPLDGPAQLTIRLLQAALSRRLRTIVYTQSRKLAELLTVWASRRSGHLADRISVYRAGLLAEERRRIERQLASGELLAVISTSALELGIDIGNLDLCILVGYPGSMVATWQRSGRVGRGGQPSAMVLVAGEDALDQYFIRNPKVFMTKPPEAAVLNPDNPRILSQHLECAAAEHPLDRNEPFFQTNAVRKAADNLARESVLLESADGRRLFALRKIPHRDISLRGGGSQFTIINRPDNAIMGEIDGSRVYREAHPGAIYLHNGVTYLVDEVDPEARRVFVEPASVSYYTRPRAVKHTDIIDVLDRRPMGGTNWYYGRLRVTEQVTGYERWHIRDRRRLGIEPLDLPEQVYDTEGVWIELPPRLMQDVERARLHLMGGIHALEHAAIGILPLLVLADRNDFGGISVPDHPDSGTGVIFIYEGMQGGAGLSAEAFRRGEELIRHTRRAIASCGCETGCPACIQSPKCGSGNRPLDKAAALLMADRLCDALVDPADTLPAPEHRQVDSPNPEPPVNKADRAPRSLISAKQRKRQLRRRRRRINPTRMTSAAPDPLPVADIDPSVSMGKGVRDGLHYAVFDIETQRSAADVGGWHRADLMRVSVAVLYDSAVDDYRVYHESDVPALLRDLTEFDLVIGFNVKRFDYRVLSGYGFSDPENVQTLDLLEEVHRQLGFRLSLDHLAGQTLGAEKTADGLQALRWWKQGKIQEITDYCRHDVEITRDLYRFGKENGYLLFKNKAGQQVRVPAPWQHVSDALSDSR